MTVHHAITWAHMTALEHGGHDKFLPSLANDELRFTMASIREHFSSAANLSIDETLAWSKCQGRLTAATTTLDRLREALALVNQNGDLIAFRGRVTVALARQPEAPVRPNTGGGKCGQMFTSADDYPRPYPPPCPECAWPMGDVHSGDCKLMCRPEAPKGQGEQPERVFPDGLICMMSDGEFVHVRKLQTDLDAANARIADFEDAIAIVREERDRYRGDMRAANARADAAERANADLIAGLRAANAEFSEANDQLAQKLDAAELTAKALEQQVADGLTVRADLRTERDRLAARVKELEQDRERIVDDLGSNQCPPEELAVLEACRAMRLEEEDADDEPGEPVEVGEDCYIYTDDQHAIVRAELANRAAKAKRGGQ